ncbi:VCBS repeat-containing protein [Lentzea sp. NPDC051838]|uniref:FG-GAP repeat domain-containing protein n=1 Tax=Lentzea sp. NPDC051838 TaxID=3154849 RepID=UPI00343F517B
MKRFIAAAVAVVATITVTTPASASGSGFFDIVYLDRNAEGTVSAWRNVNGLGSPTFPGGPREIGRGWPGDELKFGDLDGDTYDDMISLNERTGVVRAFRNVNGTFPGSGVVVGTGWTGDTYRSTFFADIDGDGRDEIISFRRGHTGEVWAWRNTNGLTGNTYSAGYQVIGTGWSFPDRSYFADINGDGKDEIISVESTGEVWAHRNVNGLNGFPYTAGRQVIGTGWNRHWGNPWALKFADINNDRRAEIISIDSIVDGSGVWAYRNVNGLNGFPYTEPGRKIATGFDDFRTFFGEIFA